MDIKTALEGILDNLEWAKNSNGHKLRKIGGMWVDNIGPIGPGEGIQLKMANPDRLTYVSTPPLRFYNELLTLTPEFLKFEGGNPSVSVYTIYIHPQGLEIGDEIAAFKEGAMLGSTVICSDMPWNNDLNIFSTLINGQGYQVGHPIILKLWDKNEQVLYNLETEFFDPFGDAFLGEYYPSDQDRYSVAKVFKSNIDDGFLPNKQISIYPNPASNKVGLYSPSSILTVKLIDQKGIVLKEWMVGDTKVKLDVSVFPSGFYVLNIITQSGILNKTIIVY
jgi:Secretion system C-terminal sorting domain